MSPLLNALYFQRVWLLFVTVHFYKLSNRCYGATVFHYAANTITHKMTHLSFDINILIMLIYKLYINTDINKLISI